MTKLPLLIIEDNQDIVDTFRTQLEDQGFQLDHALDGTQGIELALKNKYLLIILDLTLPGLDGLDVCRQIRQRDLNVRILILSARTEEIDKVLGLELGADDYLTKPFGVRELVARIRALLRRTESSTDCDSADQLCTQESSGAVSKNPKAVLSFGDLLINLDKRRIQLRGKDVKITATEFDLLAFLAVNCGHPYTRDDLVRNVWGYESHGHEKLVTCFVRRVRTRIEKSPENPQYLLTVHGFGYRFCEPHEVQASPDNS